MPIASPLSQRRTVIALMLLTFATGLVDAVSVLVLGRVFVANMTGNAIFLGFLFVPSTGFDLTAAIVAVAGFLLGAVIGGRLFRSFGQRPRYWLTIALGLEAVMLLVLAALAGMGVLDYYGTSKLLLIAGLAIAFGVQNSSARQFGIQELYTTVLTSTIVGIGVDSRLAGGTGERGKLRYGVVFVMILGAVVGATLTPIMVAPVIAIAGIVVLASLALFRYG
ncbi:MULTISPECIES: YoaK family protein [unclassified Mycobacterium]|uniref:YoaK family protein n=1 Tax=unclassified Mycobacterium TaxID=2642494 RepID=UPI0003F5B76C|nr:MULTISPECIES: YoaK family protein [unclassified Mycobacterium]